MDFAGGLEFTTVESINKFPSSICFAGILFYKV